MTMIYIFCDMIVLDLDL